MMCPVAVANEMSGLRDRIGRMKHSQRRIADAFISGPSLGAGDEDQGSHYTSDEWGDQLDPGGGDFGDVGPATEAVAEKVGHARLRRALRPAIPTPEPETGTDGRCGDGSKAVPGTLFRSQREALCGKAPRGASNWTQLHLGQDGASGR